MYERNIGARLTLVADFARASEQAVEGINAVKDSLESLKTAAGRFDLQGLSDLQAKLGGLTAEANAAKTAIGGFNSAVGGSSRSSSAAAKNVDAYQASMSGVASKARAASDTVSDYTSNTTRASAASKKAAEDISTMTGAVSKLNAEAGTTTASLLRLTTSTTLIGEGAVFVNRLGVALAGLTAEAVRSMQAVNDLDAAILRLPANRTVRIEVLTGGMPGGGPAMLPGGFNAPPGAYSGGPIRAGGYVPPMPLPGGNYQYGNGPRALTGGPTQYGSGPGQPSGYGPIPSGGYVPPTPPPLMLTGGTGGPGGGGGGPNFGQIGSGMMGMGNALSHAGNNMFWGGFSGVMVSSMVMGMMAPIFKEMTDIDDMLHMTYEALAHAGATPQNAKKFADGIMKMSETVGGDPKGNVEGIYPFVSSLPTFQAGLNLNDANTQSKLTDMYKGIVELQQVDTMTGAPNQDPYDLSLLVAATAKNLGYRMDNIASTHDAYMKALNVLVQVKNKTGSTAGQAALAFRQIGPIASNAGIDPDELVGMVGILGESKILGPSAGNQLRRILSRQSMDPKAVQKLQTAVKNATGGQFDLSEYDAHGNQRGLNDLIAQIATIEAHGDHGGPMSAQGRAKIEGTLAGLYAGPALGAIVKFASGAIGTGKDGAITEQDIKNYIEKYAEDLIHKMPQGSLANETPLTATKRIRSTDNVRTQEQMTDATLINTEKGTFDALKPDIISVLKLLADLARAFGSLPEPVRRFAVEGLALGAILAGFVGIGGMFVGSLLKMAGGLEWILGLMLKGVPSVAGFAGSFPVLGEVVSSAATALFAIPFIGWIAGIVAAGVLLYEAWTHDWGGIREKTEAAGHSIGSAIQGVVGWFHDLPSKVGPAFAALGTSLGEFAGKNASMFLAIRKDVDDWAKDLPGRVKNAYDQYQATQNAAYAKQDADSKAEDQKRLEAINKWWHDALGEAIQGGNDITGFFTGWFALGTRLWHDGAKNFGNAFMQGLKDGFTGGAASAQAAMNASMPHGHAPWAAASLPSGLGAHPGGSTTPFFLNHSAPQQAGPTNARAAQIASASPAAIMFSNPPPPAQTAAAYGGGGSLANSNIDGALNAMNAGKPKVKKAAKEIADVMLSITGHPPTVAKNESVQQIETLARQMEASLKANGAKIKEQWIDLFDPNTGEVLARVKGNVTAFRNAINKSFNKGANFFQEASDAAKKEEDSWKHISGLSDQAIKDFANHILSFKTDKMSQHVKDEIDHLATGVENAGIAAQKRIAAAFNKVNAPFDKDYTKLEGGSGNLGMFAAESAALDKIGTDQARYQQKIQNVAELQKNPNQASTSDMIATLKLEQDEWSKLTSDVTAAQNEYNRIGSVIQDLKDKQAGLDRTTADGQAAYAEAQVKIDAYTQEQDKASDAIDNTKVSLDKLNVSISDYINKIEAARTGTSQWAQMVAGAFEKGVQSASDTMGQAAGNAVDKFVNDLLGKTGKGSPFENAIANFFKTFITNIVQQMLEVSTNSMLKNILGGGSSSSGPAVGPGGWLSQILSKTGQPATTSVQAPAGGFIPNGGIIPGSGGGGMLPMSSGSGVDVVLRPESGNTDVGSQIGDGITALANAAQRGESSSSPEIPKSGDPATVTAQQTTKSNKTLTDISKGVSDVVDAYAAYSAITTEQGTIGGALQAGAAVEGLFSGGAAAAGGAGPYVAAAVAIYTLLAHSDDPASMPDKYNTKVYGQTTADLLGAPAGASGNTFYPDQATEGAIAQTGAATGAGAIQEWLASQNPNAPPPGISQKQWAKELQSWTNLFGADPTGAGVLTHPDPKNIGTEEIVDPNAKGGNNAQPYQTFGAAMAQIEQFMQATAAAQLQAQQNANQLAASFTTLLLNGPAGFSFPGALSGASGAGNGGGGNGPGFYGGFKNLGGKSGSGKQPGDPNAPGGGYNRPGFDPGNNLEIHILENVTSISGNPDEIKKMMVETAPELAAAINKANYQQSRLRGGSASWTDV